MNSLKLIVKRLADRVEELENTVAIHQSEDHEDTLEKVKFFCLECPIRETAECHRCYLYSLVVREGGIPK